MYFIGLLIIFVIFSILDFLIIKIQIKSNASLFYCIHRDEVIKSLKKIYKDDLL